MSWRSTMFPCGTCKAETYGSWLHCPEHRVVAGVPAASTFSPLDAQNQYVYGAVRDPREGREKTWLVVRMGQSDKGGPIARSELVLVDRVPTARLAQDIVSALSQTFWEGRSQQRNYQAAP